MKDSIDELIMRIMRQARFLPYTIPSVTIVTLHIYPMI